MYQEIENCFSIEYKTGEIFTYYDIKESPIFFSK